MIRRLVLSLAAASFACDAVPPEEAGIARDAVIATEEAALQPESFTPGQRFGERVAIDGDTIVVGARGDDSPSIAGSAYVFVREGQTWSEQAKLEAPEDPPGELYAGALAIHDDTVLVGRAFLPSFQGNLDEVDVWVRSGQVWARQATLTDDTVLPQQGFGYAVAVWNDTAAVSGPSRVNVYVRTAGKWALETVVTPLVPDPADDFGSAVALYEDTLVVGSATLDPNGLGATYMFVRSNGTWNEQAKFESAGAAYGSAVAIDGDTAIVGAAYMVNPQADHGRAYVYRRTGSTWAEEAVLSAPDEHPFNGFGASTAISGEIAIIGAYGQDDDGAAYIFTRAGSSWGDATKLVNPNATEGDFGWAVGIDGATAVVTRPGTTKVEGAAHVYTLEPEPQGGGGAGGSGTTSTTSSSSASPTSTSSSQASASAGTGGVGGGGGPDEDDGGCDCRSSREPDGGTCLLLVLFALAARLKVAHPRRTGRRRRS